MYFSPTYSFHVLFSHTLTHVHSYTHTFINIHTHVHSYTHAFTHPRTSTHANVQFQFISLARAERVKDIGQQELILGLLSLFHRYPRPDEALISCRTFSTTEITIPTIGNSGPPTPIPIPLPIWRPRPETILD